jgi:hypothetical protein
VQWCRKSAYLLMAIIVLSTPVMVCALPGMVLSEAEKECCRHMAGECGSSQMEDSHTCCTKVPSTAVGALHPTSKYSPILLDVSGDPVPNPAFTLTPCAAIAAIAHLPRCESPPGHVSILRI